MIASTASDPGSRIGLMRSRPGAASITSVVAIQLRPRTHPHPPQLLRPTTVAQDMHAGFEASWRYRCLPMPSGPGVANTSTLGVFRPPRRYRQPRPRFLQKLPRQLRPQQLQMQSKSATVDVRLAGNMPRARLASSGLRATHSSRNLTPALWPTTLCSSSAAIAVVAPQRPRAARTRQPCRPSKSLTTG